MIVVIGLIVAFLLMVGAIYALAIKSASEEFGFRPGDDE